MLNVELRTHLEAETLHDIFVTSRYFQNILKFHENLKITVNFKIQLQKSSYMFVEIKIIGQSQQKTM